MRTVVLPIRPGNGTPSTRAGIGSLTLASDDEGRATEADFVAWRFRHVDDDGTRERSLIRIAVR